MGYLTTPAVRMRRGSRRSVTPPDTNQLCPGPRTRAPADRSHCTFVRGTHAIPPSRVHAVGSERPIASSVNALKDSVSDLPIVVVTRLSQYRPFSSVVLRNTMLPLASQPLGSDRPHI